MNFSEFAVSVGLVSRSFIADGKIHRCGTNKKPRSLNGAYMCDGKRGFAMDWSSGSLPSWWNDKNARPWSEADKKAWACKRREHEADRIAGYIDASKTATKILSECFIDTHPYLKLKGHVDSKGLIASNGATMPHPNGYNIPIDGALIVPMRNCRNNSISGFQAIKWDERSDKFKKLFLPGMRAKEAIFKIGSGSDVVLCEGYATGLSIHSAASRLKLNISVMCCFSASNLIEVAKTHGKYVLADHDQSKTGEQSAQATGLSWLMPEEVDMDWNDVHVRDGLMHVCKALMSIRRIKNTRAVGNY